VRVPLGNWHNWSLITIFFLFVPLFLFNFVFFGDFDLCFLNFIYFCGHFIILGCCVKHVIAEILGHSTGCSSSK
jgi:hypothetical protein